MRLKYSNPMCVDDVAADFPQLDIILAHPSFPWQDEAPAIAVHKPSVYIDLSGWSPKYFPENLIRCTNSQLKHKILFGSDYPLITPDRWLADFEKPLDQGRGAATRSKGERGALAPSQSCVRVGVKSPLALCQAFGKDRHARTQMGTRPRNGSSTFDSAENTATRMSLLGRIS